MADLQIELVLSGSGRARLLIGGLLNEATVPQFEARAAAMLADSWIDAVTVDLSDVTVPEMAGISALLNLRDAAKTTGKTIVFVNVPAELRQRLW